MTTEPVRIYAVVFDVDGTLYRNRSMYRVSALHVLRNLRLYHAFGRARSAVRRAPPDSDLAGATAELTARFLGQPVAATAVRIRTVIYDRWTELLRRVRLVAGLEEFLNWLRRNGIATAVLSDFPVERKLEVLGVGSHFSVRLSAEDVGRLKPDPRPFLAIARALEVEPRHVLYVGNSYRNDVIGARDAGMASIHLARRPVPGSPAIATVPDFVALKRWMMASTDGVKLAKRPDD